MLTLGTEAKYDNLYVLIGKLENETKTENSKQQMERMGTKIKAEEMLMFGSLAAQIPHMSRAQQ